jgi:DNA-directed RNA polymerase specialized sigma24 family protein/anti-sigma factor ChrR (cupin superfamily)
VDTTRRTEGSRATLGGILRANLSHPVVSERDWVWLVRGVAAGDQLALHSLFERTHRLVFTLLMRSTGNREVAEALTLQVYLDVWQQSLHYDATEATVLGWVMNLARARIAAPHEADLERAREQGRALNVALATLTAEEREAIEAAYFSEQSYVELAARLKLPLRTVTARMRSALVKLRQALGLARREFAQDGCCDHAELVCAHALRALSAAEAPVIEGHLASCARCRRGLDSVSPVVDAFVAWPTAVLRPSAALQPRLVQRLAEQSRGRTMLPLRRRWSEPEWEEAAPGLWYKLLAVDSEQHRVSMLVRLGAGGQYPPHTHAGVEELHLLEGELRIDERRLHPGDYNRAEAGSGDQRVWSETGCACVLVTSTRDRLLG